MRWLTLELFDDRRYMPVHLCRLQKQNEKPVRLQNLWKQNEKHHYTSHAVKQLCIDYIVRESNSRCLQGHNASNLQAYQCCTLQMSSSTPIPVVVMQKEHGLQSIGKTALQCDIESSSVFRANSRTRNLSLWVKELAGMTDSYCQQRILSKRDFWSCLC